jgi:hypothetical protein
MSMVAKILVVVNLFLAVAVMGAAGAYLNASAKWKADHAKDTEVRDATIKELEANNAKAVQAKDEALTSKAAAELAKTAAEASALTLQKHNDMLKDRLNEQAASIAGINGILGDFKQNLESARAQIETLTKEKGQAEADRREALDKQNAAELESKRLAGELTASVAAHEAAMKANADANEALEASNTELAIYKANFPPPSGINQAAVKGQVLAASAADDIYVLSIGSKDGVKENDELTAYRGDDFVAVLVVYQVEGDKCAASVKRIDGKPFKRGEVRTGDKVSSLL